MWYTCRVPQTWDYAEENWCDVTTEKVNAMSRMNPSKYYSKLQYYQIVPKASHVYYGNQQKYIYYIIFYTDVAGCIQSY